MKKLREAYRTLFERGNKKSCTLPLTIVSFAWFTIMGYTTWQHVDKKLTPIESSPSLICRDGAHGHECIWAEVCAVHHPPPHHLHSKHACNMYSHAQDCFRMRFSMQKAEYVTCRNCDTCL